MSLEDRQSEGFERVASRSDIMAPHGSDAARFLRLAIADIARAQKTPEARDDGMPGILESTTAAAQTMTRLWDAETWAAHRSTGRWLTMIRTWPESSILRRIQVPLYSLLILTTVVVLLNRGLQYGSGDQKPWITLPSAPLSLQAASIGLLLVFRTNQTHDRLKEAQRAVGSLGALASEIMQLLLVHVSPERYRDVGVAARLLALYGWALKTQCRSQKDQLMPIAQVLLPRANAWLLRHERRTAAVLLRLRAVAGSLKTNGALNSDAFKFVEERMSKLSAVDAACTRLATFPVPPSYHRHASRALILWLGSLPFVLEGIGCAAWQTYLGVFCTTFLLLGIDQIAIEIEQPLDVLPLHAFAACMSTEVARTLESWWLMPALPGLNDDESGLGGGDEACGTIDETCNTGFDLSQKKLT